jgi:hypothetical protein
VVKERMERESLIQGTQEEGDDEVEGEDISAAQIQVT